MENPPTKCNNCNNSFTNLTIMSCNHQFCHVCALKLFLANFEILLTNFLQEEMTLQCLQCQTGELKITRNAIYNLICSLQTDTHNPFCIYHYQDKKVFCVECCIPMCQICFDRHKLDYEQSYHESIEQPIDYEQSYHESIEQPIDYEQSYHESIEQPNNSDDNNKCSHHNDLLTSHCINCFLPLCEQCKNTDHKDHNIESLKDFYENKRNVLLCDIKLPFYSLQDCESFLEKENKQVKEEIIKHSTFNMDRHYDSLVPMIEEITEKVKQLEDEWRVKNELVKTLYNTLYGELEILYSNDDFFNIKLLSKLPKDLNIPKMNDQFIQSSSGKLQEIKEIVDKVNDEINYFITLEIEEKCLEYNDKLIVKTLSGHAHKIVRLIQLKDGKLASGSQDRQIRIWDPLDNYNCINILIGHSLCIDCLIQLKDGKLASASFDETIRIWNPADSYNCSHILMGGKPIFSLIQLKDGKLASGHKDGIIKLWDPQNNYSCVKTVNGHPKNVYYLLQLKDGQLASCSYENTILLWDLKNSKCKILNGHTDVAVCLLQLKNGYLASGASDRTIRLWDPRNNYICVKTITGQKTGIRNLIQLGDGKLVSGSSMELKVWDPLYEYKCINTLKGPNEGDCCLIQLKDGKLASTCERDTLRVWNPQEDFKVIKILKGHKNIVRCLIQLKDGKLVSASDDSTIRLWENFI